MRQILTLLAVTIITTAMGQPSTPQLTKDNIDEVLRAMTLEEKAQLLVGGGQDGFAGSGAMLGQQKKLVAGAAGTTVGIPRLGIPATCVADGPAGVHIAPTREGTDHTFYATGFPVGTCLASTWNVDIVQQVGEAMGNETLEYGIDVLLGPGMNLQRSPLCGRNFEYYSEDPLVTGLMATAVTKGIQSQGVGVSAKHFAVNSQESDRERVDEHVSQRALRELYLKGFEILVRQAKPWTVMSSYNKVNGTWAQGHRDLLTTILRDEWGFDGIVMTDWIGERATLPVEQEVEAGNELMMPGYPAQAAHIVDAVRSGRLAEADVDRNVRRMLEYIVRTPRFRGYQYSDRPDLKAHAVVARQGATEGMVLLKNDTLAARQPVLPLHGVKTVALFGVNSYDFLSCGLGSGHVKVPYVVNIAEGLRNAGIATTPQLTGIYQAYQTFAKAKLAADKNPMMWFLNEGTPKVDEIDISERCVAHECREADAAIITIGRQAGEGLDRTIDDDFNLTSTEQRLILRVAGAFHAAGKPVVVVINSGSVIETASWRDHVDAILCAWQPGMEGGNAVADILTGKVSPSGHLTQTWPIAATDNPAVRNFPKGYDMYTYTNLERGGSPIPFVDYTNHEEDIYVGYRYFDTFRQRVAYPFGFGLSYTSFVYGKPRVKFDGRQVTIDVMVTNTGSAVGKEVVQVYVAAPKGTLEKPAKELKAFAKTRELKPGESQTLHMTIAHRDLASFDEEQSQWVADAGVYTFHIGASVADIRQRVTAKVGTYVEPCHNVMSPAEGLPRLTCGGEPVR